MDIFTRPSVTQFILLRISILAVAILALFYILLVYILGRGEDVWLDISLLAIAMGIIMLASYIGAKRVETRLDAINNSLQNFTTTKKLPTNMSTFTKEFDDISKNLAKVLQRAKKRESDKQKYSAKLKLKNRQRGEMISAIAHEFRNPISSIMGYAQTLHEDRDISRATEEKFLEKIYNNGQKIEDLLSRLILWNKFESGDTKLHMSSFSLYHLIEESIASLEDRYRDRTITIAGDDRTISADRTLIEIVLKNLIENAIKYSDDEVIVKISPDKISVIDSGAGISESDISKVTKKFYRSPTHNWDNSMGLGLSIVKTILNLHNTKLHIESIEKKGSTFYFTM